jgi:hypothetical protein
MRDGETPSWPAAEERYDHVRAVLDLLARARPSLGSGLVAVARRDTDRD